MDAKAVTLMLRYKAADGTWRRSPAAYGKNGRVKPGHVVVDGKIHEVGAGKYSVRHTVGRKTAYTPVGTRADVADAKREQLARTKSLIAAAESNPDVEIIEKGDRKTLAEAATEYIASVEARGAAEAAEQARLVVKEFTAVCRHTFVDQVTADNFFAFYAALRRVGRSDRTVANKHSRLASWLRFAGIDPKRIPPRPRYEESLPNMYSREQTQGLLDAANPAQRMVILLALKTGLRDQELRHLEFADINWTDGTLRVRSKPAWKFRVKTWEQRNVPVPQDLLANLKTWQDRNEGGDLVLGTRNRTPNSRLLVSLKRLARKAGLNCGVCEGCLARHHECQEYTLHRFRRTYLTTLLRQGVDLRTVQAYAGHRDIKSTMRYLSPETGEAAQAKINAIQW